VYYHCTCSRPYTREETLERKFADFVARIVIKEQVLDLFAATINQVHDQQAEQHAAAVTRLQREYKRLQDRINAAYVDKLDGKIDAALFERKADEWRAE
jgi:predicted aminopeptidase